MAASAAARNNILIPLLHSLKLFLPPAPIRHSGNSAAPPEDIDDCTLHINPEPGCTPPPSRRVSTNARPAGTPLRAVSPAPVVPHRARSLVRRFAVPAPNA